MEKTDQRMSITLPSLINYAGCADEGSRIKFAPGTNFQEGLTRKRMSEDSTFNIRMVGKGANLSRSLNSIPSETKLDISYTNEKIARQQKRLPGIVSEGELVGKLRRYPALMGMDIPTLCSYVADRKPLLMAAKHSIKKSSLGKTDDCVNIDEVQFPLRFPPLSSSPNPHKLVGIQQLTTDRSHLHTGRNLTKAGKHSSHHGSTDSLNLYLRQSTFHSDMKNGDIFRPYLHVPNLVDSRLREKTFLRDNERIRMLQISKTTDDYNGERFEAYKPPDSDSLKQDFITT